MNNGSIQNESSICLTLGKYFNAWMRQKNDYWDYGLSDFVVTTDDMNGIEDKLLDRLIDDIRKKNLQATPKNKFSKHHYQLYK